MKPMKLFSSLAFVALLFSCGSDSPVSPGKDLFADNVDSTANPAQDFFQFANGKWLKNNPIPSTNSSWGIGNKVHDEIYTKLRKINEDAAAEKATSGDSQQIGDFWATGMDSIKADKLGLAPIEKELKMIEEVKDVKGVVSAMVAFEPYQIGMFYGGYYVGQDSKNSEAIILTLWQGGLGLPDRDYYFNSDDETKKIREEYVKYISQVLVLSGTEKTAADQMSSSVMAFETELAKNSRKLEDQRDPYKNYNKMHVDQVTKILTPSINWREVSATHGISKIDSVVVGQPEFFSALEKTLHTTGIEVLKSYMKVQVVGSFAPYLSTDISQTQFEFYGKTLNGIKEQKPRWKRVLDTEEEAMGMVLGKLYVKENFPANTKKRYNDLVESIRTAYAERIKKLDWMSDVTKAKALDKLSKMSKKVGYPDKWKDFSTLIVGTNSYCENIMNSSRWHFKDMISKYGKPVDRTEWEMTPQTYNAYYNPSNNEIVLPAAIFAIPGSVDSLVDDAVIFGYAGASTIGHEITHGFDDQGRNFDAAGNLVSWWTSEDSAKFEARSAVMVRQFNSYEPLPGKHINGAASLGENIADYGGILLGIDAFKQTEQYKKGEKIGGFTPMQRYFLGYSLGWMGQQTPESLGNGLMSDVHSPAKWRVLGPFSNIPEFYEAFGVKEGDAMWRADSVRVSIW